MGRHHHDGATPAVDFRHAVASFDPTPDGVLLWTRVSRPDGGPADGVAVRWWVAPAGQGEASGPVVASGTAMVAAAQDGCVRVDVEGLEPATTYHYGFEADGVRSPLGRTRTAPDGPTPWLRLAVTSCADRSMGPLSAYRAIADDEVDLVLHVGDYIYEDPKGPHPVEPPGVVVSLEEYRARHAFTRLDPDLQAMHRRHPMVFVWDDHDTADNSWRHGAKAHDPEVQGDWEDRVRAAARARDEWLPARLADPSEPLDMHRSLVLGDLAELVVLDTRIPGRDRQSGDEGAKALHDPDRRLLDPAQRRWAHERVRDRTRRWCLLASQVPVSAIVLPVPAGSKVDPAMPSGYRVVDDEVVCTDQWDGYPAERDALCDAIADRGPGVVAVSGDVHSYWATYLSGGRTSEPVAAEFVCTAVSSTPMGEQLPPGWREVADDVADGVPVQQWHDLVHHGYLRLDVRPDRVRADAVAVEPDGARPRVRYLASWSVDRSWPPVLEPAVPSSSTAAFADVVRPGLRATDLPGSEPPAPLPRRRRWLPVLAGAAVAAVVAVAVRRRAARRRHAPSAVPAQVAAASASAVRAVRAVRESRTRPGRRSRRRRR